MKISFITFIQNSVRQLQFVLQRKRHTSVVGDSHGLQWSSCWSFDVLCSDAQLQKRSTNQPRQTGQIDIHRREVGIHDDADVRP